MFEGARQQVGLLYAGLHFRKYGDRIQNFPDALARARRALVIFPDTPLDGESASLVLKHLAARFANGGLTVVIRQELRSALLTIPSVKMVTYTPTEISSWFIPSSALVRRSRVMAYDIAVDLNIRFSLTSAFLCKASNAAVRISFAKEHGDRFYNMQFRARGTTTSPAPYRGFIRCLEMFECL